MARYIDPELPFTEAEIRRALRLVASASEAKEVAREIAQLPAEAALGVAAAAEARTRGSTAPEEINPPSWYVSDEIFALLACMSDSAAKRVDRLMERRWREWTESSIRTRIGVHRVTDEAELPPEVITSIRRKVGRWKAGWTRKRRRIARLVASAAKPVAAADEAP